MIIDVILLQIASFILRTGQDDFLFVTPELPLANWKKPEKIISLDGQDITLLSGTADYALLFHNSDAAFRNDMGALQVKEGMLHASLTSEVPARCD